MQHGAAVRRCLRDGNVAELRKLWAEIAPHLPQPRNDTEALASLHYARTISDFVGAIERRYSHRWLIDNGCPSGLPDHLKPKAERVYPSIVEGVGIASMSAPGAMKSLFNHAVEKVMSDAVLESYADGHAHEPHIVKARILEKRSAFKRRA